mmetsp:Transcript_36901/g.42406  ORF Transcript_36901/g.42406 Transcript_36901/m.42406 type:complete len:83 (+) Transcript_36901:476-724(+)
MISRSTNKTPNNDRAKTFYMGPDFSSLSKKIQISLSQYLIDNGLDQQTVAFIELFSLDKEQRLYMKWLKDVQSFINKDNRVV